jgi:hypothetical protein
MGEARGTELIFLGHELNVQDSNVLTQQRGGFLKFLAQKRQLLSGSVLEDVPAKHEAKEIGESRSSIGIQGHLAGGVDVAGNRAAPAASFKPAARTNDSENLLRLVDPSVGE